MKIIKNISPALISVPISVVTADNQPTSFVLKYNEFIIVNDNDLNTKSIIIQSKKGNISVVGYTGNREPYKVYGEKIIVLPETKIKTEQDNFKEETESEVKKLFKALKETKEHNHIQDHIIEVPTIEFKHDFINDIQSDEEVESFDDLDSDIENEFDMTEEDILPKSIEKLKKTSIKKPIQTTKKETPTKVKLSGRENNKWPTISGGKSYDIIKQGKTPSKTKGGKPKEWYEIIDDTGEKLQVNKRALLAIVSKPK
jgi:hypothetical protein